jgi:hypothetical protein
MLAGPIGLEGIVSNRKDSAYVRGLAQDEEPGGIGRETRGRRRLGQKQMATTAVGKNRIMIFGPKTDGTYVVEFRTAEGEAPFLQSACLPPRREGAQTMRRVLRVSPLPNRAFDRSRLRQPDLRSNDSAPPRWRPAQVMQPPPGNTGCGVER